MDKGYVYLPSAWKGRFVWPTAREGTVRLSRAQLSMLIDGMDWRRAVLEPEPVQRVWCN